VLHLFISSGAIFTFNVRRPLLLSAQVESPSQCENNQSE
jgi:hypothetical protein